jgi:DNA-binding MarR family transcriptional regulator
MTNRLKRLAASGLVKRIPDPTDGRGILVGLTPEGRRLVDEAVAAHTANEHRLLSKLTADEKRQLGALLRKLLLQFDDGHPDGRLARASAPQR